MSKRDTVDIEKEIDNVVEPNSNTITSTSEVRRSKKVKVEQPIPPVPNKPRQCHFFVKRKRRYCHLTTSLGIKYCGEHSNCINDEEELAETDSAKAQYNPYVKEKKRIPCPLDPKHTIFEKDLAKHSLRCNARPPTDLPAYFSKDVNFANEDVEQTKLADQPLEKISEFLSSIDSVYDDVAPLIPEAILDHPVLDHQKEKKAIVKHVMQQASLIGHLKNEGLLVPSNCFIEFGAGKGELSLYVSQALDMAFPENVPSTPIEMSSEKSASFVLVDRSSFRFKFDRYFKGESEDLQKKSSRFHRVTLDIKDLDLSKLDIVGKRPIVAYSKHLCGAATDLTLSSLANFHRAGGRIAGLVLALCCHHSCSLKAYPSIKYLEQLGVLKSRDQFGWLSSMCSWATCGLRSETTETNAPECNPGHFTKLPHSQRGLLGLKAKRILDVGRLSYIKETLDLNARLVRYAGNNLTLENVALIATPNSALEK